MPLVSGRRLRCFTSVFVSTFFTKNSGGFGARCGTSYLLLSFQASRGEWLVPLPLSPIMEPFFKIMRVCLGACILCGSCGREQTLPSRHGGTERNLEYIPVCPLSTKSVEGGWGNPVHQGLLTSGQRECIIFTASHRTDN